MRRSRTRGAAALVGAALGVALFVAVAAAMSRSADRPDLLDQPFTASNGLSSRYHLFQQGVPGDGPVGLLVQFHGDGAYEFENPDSDYSLGGPDGIVAQAREHDLLTLAVLTPDRDGEVTWWEEGDDNADYVRDLLVDVVLAEHDIDTSDIWLVGYSGGAQFITQFFLPRYSALLDGGGSVVFGGGGTPRTRPGPFAESLTERFPMHWYTGAEDDGRYEPYDALTDARRGSRWYRSQGFPVTLEVPPGVGHHGLPFGAVVGEQLAAAARATAR